MNQQSNLIFKRSRLKLTILYSAVIGAILCSLGGIAHTVMHRAFDRIVDRELDLLSKALNAQLMGVLQTPGVISPQAKQVFPELCWLSQPCQPVEQRSLLQDLHHDGYHIQILNLNGQIIAAIAEAPDNFPNNLQLLDSQTVRLSSGEAFHIHLLPLKSAQSQPWGYLQVSRSVQQMDDYMRNLQWLLIGGVPVSMLMIGGVSWKLAGVAMRPIYQSYVRMQQFTTDVAHELKTPLATTQAIVETALNEAMQTPEHYYQTLQSLDRQNQRLNQLVQDLLFLTRLDHQVAPPGQSIDLNELIEDIEEELAPLAIAAQIDLSCQIEIQPPFPIYGNTNQLYRMLSNLVTNGISYSPAGSKVIIYLKQIGNEAVIQVEDHGVGIAAANLPHLFERFYRVNRDRSRSTGGSGLGLAIVQAIAQAHGGRVEVVSQVGRGSIFTVYLPV
jgi:signal transduction histidine kinase